MAKIILDLGSGNTCRNDHGIIEEMIYAIKSIDTGKHEVILKWQLFESAPPNVPLKHEAFEYAYRIGAILGYETTSSVFDKQSLAFLLKFDIPFVKIACRPELYKLAPDCGVSVYGSYYDFEPGVYVDTCLACVPKYPALLKDYEDRFTPGQLKIVSDHTVGWRLFNKYRPDIIEKHFVLERDEKNPDSGPFAVTPKELEQIL